MKWLLVAGGVAAFIWYENQKQAIPLAANKQATQVINSAGGAVSNIINEAGPAIGKWIGGLFGGSTSSNSSTFSNPSPTSVGAAYSDNSFDFDPSDLGNYGAEL